MTSILTDMSIRHSEDCCLFVTLQMHRRNTQSRLPIQGNFFPMTAAAFIEDATVRMTLLSAQSHGVASLQQGTKLLLLLLLYYYYYCCCYLDVLIRLMLSLRHCRRSLCSGYDKCMGIVNIKIAIQQLR